MWTIEKYSRRCHEAPCNFGNSGHQVFSQSISHVRFIVVLPIQLDSRIVSFVDKFGKQIEAEIV